MIPKLKRLLFNNLGTRQTVVKNIFWLSFGQIAGRFTRAIIIIYAARILGVVEYGIFSYALGLAAFFTTFSDIGLGSILTREVSQHPEKEDHYFVTAFWIKIVLILISAAAIILIAPYFSKIEGAKILMPIVALLIIFDNLRDFSLAFFRAKEKMEWEAFVTILTNVLIVLLGFLILYYFKTAMAFTISYTLSSGLGLIAAIFILRNQIVKILSHFNKELLRPIITSALPIALTATFGAFMVNIDVLMLGWLSGAREVGLYAAPQKIVQFFSIFPGILASSVFPVISRLVGQNEKERIKSLAEKTIATTLSIAFPIAIGGAVLGSSIMGFVFGNEYLPATLAFQILIITVISNFPSPFLSNLMLAYNKQKEAVIYIIGASLLNVILNIIFIKLFGIAGAALATLATVILFNAAVWRIARKTNDFYIFRHLKKIILSSILMGFVAFILNNTGVNLIVNIIISASFYFLLLFILKENVLEELKSIIQAIKK